MKLPQILLLDWNDDSIFIRFSCDIWNLISCDMRNCYCYFIFQDIKWIWITSYEKLIHCKLLNNTNLRWTWGLQEESILLLQYHGTVITKVLQKPLCPLLVIIILYFIIHLILKRRSKAISWKKFLFIIPFYLSPRENDGGGDTSEFLIIYLRFNPLDAQSIVCIEFERLT